MKLSFLKSTPGTRLFPADNETADYLVELKIGSTLTGEFRKQRNPQFHRKVFALLNFLFDHWIPGKLLDPKWKGITPLKSFDRFRKDIIILAGFYEAHYRIDGSVRIQAKSISFASMDEEEFQELYNQIINVGLQKILTNYTKKELNNVIDHLLSFA